MLEVFFDGIHGLVKERVHQDTAKHAMLIASFAITIFMIGGSRVVSDALHMEQMTPALGWKMGHVYLALPIAGVFMILFTIEQLLETLFTTQPQMEGN